MPAGHVALVTGASRGIGKATAIALADAGFDVAITARTVHEGDSAEGPGSLDTTAAIIADAGARVLPVSMDLLDRASLVDGVRHVLEDWGHVDLLVNNA